MNRSVYIASILPMLAIACGSAPPLPLPPPPPPAPTAAEAPPPAPAAAAPAPLTIALEARSGSKLSGSATFTPVDGGVKVALQVAGAPPGKIATHVHEKGDCSAPDAASAGSHFNPANHKHGLPDGERHLGDLGNIDVKPDGTGTLEIVAKGANLTAGDPNSFLGKAIIVHAKVDDGSQPTGNAGGRIGCAVIAPKK